MKNKSNLASDIRVTASDIRMTLDHIDDARRHFTELALEIETGARLPNS